MSGLSIVQALLALTFYKHVPFELVSRVFQGDFIRKLEQEVQMAYRLETYPQRVMSLIMQLNRAICLDYPEFQIRWFQNNFIEAQMSKKPALRNKFQQDVHNLLLNIVPSREYLAVNRVTPYGYRVDFEIHVDENYTNKFLKPNAEFYETSIFKPKVSKIAILLLNFDTFCFNDIQRLRGEELMRMRHLEMMNYKVIHVKKSDFNILYENITAKIKHMKKLLQISTA
jgi:FAST kinase-like protein, subdomain 2/RAP domain